jgi:cold shock protein
VIHPTRGIFLDIDSGFCPGDGQNAGIVALGLRSQAVASAVTPDVHPAGARVAGWSSIQPDAAGPDVLVHISAVERAGLQGLNEGQKIDYEIVADKRSGKSSAGNLKPA